MLNTIKKLTLVAAGMIAMTATAQNPLVTHMFTADPTARVFDGKLYVYPSSDTVPPEGVKAPRFCMPGYHGFSLERGSTWKDHGWILKENDVPWGKKNVFAMWAPDCIKKDGKYYYYYPAKPEGEGTFRRIGVGVSDKPMGPFTWEKTYIKGVSGIDPGLLVDDDNKGYLFFGGGHELYGAPLSDDMKSITAEAIKIQDLPEGYKEGSFPFKKDGVYYLTFAHVDKKEKGYTIGYATSDKPLGPYTYKGFVMRKIGQGTNHHSIVKYNGQWILFYHNWALSGWNKMRSMCADYLKFNKDGSIQEVKPTLRGIGTPQKNDTIQVDRHNGINRCETAFVGGNEPAGWMVCETQAGSWVRFNRVDFGKAGSVKKMLARYSSGQRIGKIQVHIDDRKGPVVAEFPVKYTGGWNNFVTQEAVVDSKVTGVHDIYVSFEIEWGATKCANLNWLLMK